MLGFVHFPPSPRHVAPENVTPIAQAVRTLHDIPLVAVTVDPTDDAIAEIIAAYQPDFLQLHGSEDAARLRAIKDRFGIRIIKAIAVANADDIHRAVSYAPLADRIMLDAKPPKDAALPGGNGVAFDWNLPRSHPLQEGMKWMLSGGLTPDNVAQAVRQSGAALVDVSSGVEYEPGKKDPARILAFLKSCAAL